MLRCSGSGRVVARSRRGPNKCLECGRVYRPVQNSPRDPKWRLPEHDVPIESKVPYCPRCGCMLRGNLDRCTCRKGLT